MLIVGRITEKSIESHQPHLAKIIAKLSQNYGKYLQKGMNMKWFIMLI